MNKVWFITGAGRGMGVDFAKAALAAGYKVVATGRNVGKVANAIGEATDLLVVKLDVTNQADAEAAARAAIDRFGRIDVLVNNAASFYAGFFEELTPEQMQSQLATSLFGPMNVTRAILPIMRKQRSGQIITISSSAGFGGFAFGSAYAASKFGVEGWMESVHAEVEPFGIQTMIVNPGFFRTELLTQESTEYAAANIADYDTARAQQLEFWKGYNGKQSRRSGQACAALLTIKRPKRLAAPFHCRSRCHQVGRAEGCRVAAADRRPSRALEFAGVRRGQCRQRQLDLPRVSERRGLHHSDQPRRRRHKATEDESCPITTLPPNQRTPMGAV